MVKYGGGLGRRGLAGWAAVFVLFLVYALAYVDRQILSLLVAPIRADLQISDTAFSLLHGLSFAAFYALFGIPIGWWVDRGHRPFLLAAGIALWSLFTCLCGLSRSYWQLFLARMGVGVGEATVVPVTYSLLGDYFPPERRGLAMGLFGSGVYFGMGAALLIGGALVEALQAIGPVELALIGSLKPWQMAMIAVGMPGLLLALLALALREPRGASQPPANASPDECRSGSIWDHYRGSAAAIALHHLTVTFMVMSLYAVLGWAPEHFRRTFGEAASVSGMAIGLLVIVAGTAGVLAGGILSDALLRRGIGAARLFVLAGAALLAIPAVLLFALAADSKTALAGMAVGILFISTLSSVGAAGMQELVPARLRGTGGAIYQLVANLFGLGLGPTIVALATDFGFGDDRKLYASLAVTVPAMLALAAIMAIAGLAPYRRAAARVQD